MRRPSAFVITAIAAAAAVAQPVPITMPGVRYVVPPPVIETVRPPVIAPSAPAVDAAKPAAVTACDPGGCWDSQGRRLERIGPQLTGPRGACTVQAGVVQCP